MSAFNNLKIISRNVANRKILNQLREKLNKTYGENNLNPINYNILNSLKKPFHKNTSKYNVKLFPSKKNLKSSSSALFINKYRKRTPSYSNTKNHKNIQNTHSVELLKYMQKIQKLNNNFPKKIIINKIEKNTINYFINSFNISYKQKGGVCKKIRNNSNKINKVNDIKNKNDNNNNEFNNNINKKIEIKQNNSDNLTNFNINTINYSSVNENNKVNLNIELKELINKKQELLKDIDNETKNEKLYLKQIKDLKTKNTKLAKLFFDLKTEKKEYIKMLNKSFKLMKILQENGLDISQIIDNFSFSDDEESDDNERKKELNTGANSLKQSANNVYSGIYNNIRNEFTEVSYGKLETHKEFSGSKIPSEIVENIPKLKIKYINKEA